MSLIHYNFESQYLNNNTDVNIILPDKPRDKTPEQFYGSGKKYKVLWLLHGTFGDYTDWIRKSNIELYACERDLIVVMPSGLNADYVNWPDFAPGYNTWDYLFEELMPLVHHWLPASDKREDNFIAGLSMGGNGTLQYAAGHPEKFGGAAILSCAPRDLHQLAKDLEDPEFARLAEENPISAFDQLARAHEAALAAQEEAGFPLPVAGRKLTAEELAQVRCQ